MLNSTAEDCNLVAVDIDSVGIYPEGELVTVVQSDITDTSFIYI